MDLEVVVGMLFGETKVRHRDGWSVTEKALEGTAWTLMNRWKNWNWPPWDDVSHIREFILKVPSQYGGYWGPPEWTKENRQSFIAQSKDLDFGQMSDLEF